MIMPFQDHCICNNQNWKRSGTMWYILLCQKWRRPTKSFNEYLHKIPINVDLHIKLHIDHLK